MSRKPLLPLAERDGSRAYADAADKDAWREVRAATSHPHPPHSYWFPPEVADLVAEGMDWQRLEAILRPALASRGAAKERSGNHRRTHSMAPATRAQAAAVIAYFAAQPPAVTAKILSLATRVQKHAQVAGYKNWEEVDPLSHTMRDMIKDALWNMEQDQKQRPSRPRRR
jgi:hypothetical protein